MPELFSRNMVTVDLEKPLIRQDVGLVMASGDENANRFSAQVTRNGEIVDLSSCQVKGFLIRPNEETLSIDGSAEGNTVFVYIPQSGYVYDGAFTLTIKLYGSDFTKTVAIFDGRIAKTTTEAIIDGDRVVYTSEEILALIDDMERAESSATEAAGRANTAAVSAETATTAANTAATAIDGMTVSAQHGVSASAEISTVNGAKHIDFVIPKGEAGKNFKILGTYASVAALSAAVPAPNQGDVYCVGTVGSYTMHMWDTTGGNGSWLSIGEPGVAGEQGEPGYTPIKGVDYWTDADKAAVVNDVLTALPNASGVSF